MNQISHLPIHIKNLIIIHHMKLILRFNHQVQKTKPQKTLDNIVLSVEPRQKQTLSSVRLAEISYK
jgi:hypothetical protein